MSCCVVYQLQMIQVIKEDVTNSEKNLDRIQHDVLRWTYLRALGLSCGCHLRKSHFSLKGVVNAIHFTLKFNIVYMLIDLIKQTCIRNHQIVSSLSRMERYVLCLPEIITISSTQKTAYVFFFWPHL